MVNAVHVGFLDSPPNHHGDGMDSMEVGPSTRVPADGGLRAGVSMSPTDAVQDYGEGERE